MKTIRTSVRLPVDVVTGLKKLAKDTNTSVSALLIFSFRESLRQEQTEIEDLHEEYKSLLKIEAGVREQIKAVNVSIEAERERLDTAKKRLSAFVSDSKKAQKKAPAAVWS